MNEAVISEKLYTIFFDEPAAVVAASVVGNKVVAVVAGVVVVEDLSIGNFK